MAGNRRLVTVAISWITAPEREVWEAKLLRFKELLRAMGVPAEAGSGSPITK